MPLPKVHRKAVSRSSKESETTPRGGSNKPASLHEDIGDGRTRRLGGKQSYHGPKKKGGGQSVEGKKGSATGLKHLLLLEWPLGGRRPVCSGWRRLRKGD